MTTKEEIKSYYDNPMGNPFNRNNKYLNMKNSLFPLKQRKSILNIFKQGFIYLYNIKNKSINDNNNKQIKEKPDNNGNNININNTEVNVNINNYMNKEKDNTITGNTGKITKIKKDSNIEKDDTDISINNSYNNNNIISNKEKKKHKKNKSSIPISKINPDLIEKKKLNEKKDDSGNTDENGKNIIIRRNSNKGSDCSDNITNDSIEKKIPCFKTNFEDGNGNENNSGNNYDNNG